MRESGRRRRGRSRIALLLHPFIRHDHNWGRVGVLVDLAEFSQDELELLLPLHPLLLRLLRVLLGVRW